MHLVSFASHLFPFTMPSSCKEIRAELAECILKSDCVLKDGLTAKECLHADNEYRVPKECTAIKKSFFECRRGMVTHGLFVRGALKDFFFDINKYLIFLCNRISLI